MTTQHDLIPGLRAGLLEKVREGQRLMSNLTTGPWKVGEIGDGWMVADFGHGTDDEQSRVITDCVHASELDGNPRCDAEFLVWARNNLPELLREVADMVSEKSVEAISPQAWKERAEKADAALANLDGREHREVDNG